MSPHDQKKQSYQADWKQFEQFITDGQATFVESFREYCRWLDLEWAAKRYSSATFNRKVAAARGFLRQAFSEGPQSQLLREQYQLDEVLKEVKPKPIAPVIPPEEKVLELGEVKTLIAETKDQRIRFMVTFLVGTGVRISEMLALRLEDLVATNHGFYEVKIVGKGRKTRTISVKTELVEKIHAYFQGKTFLFEHDGRAYSRISVTNRIKLEALKTIGREVSAQQLRHTWAMIQIQRGKNLKAVARTLGQAGPPLRVAPDGVLRPEEAFLEVALPELSDRQTRNAGNPGSGSGVLT